METEEYFVDLFKVDNKNTRTTSDNFKHVSYLWAFCC